MAIHDNYIDKITKDGESRMISPAADNVRVDNEHYEGDNLDEVLDEIASAIDEAGSGDGTVKGVKVGSTTYDPDSETGVVDLSTPIADKVDKVPGKGLSTNDYTDADQAKLQALPTADGLTQQLSSKANASEVVKSVTINGQTQTPQSGNVSFNVQAGETVVINSDGANIVDGQSESILTAPSSRMMKEIYINLRALFDPTNGLAGIAFLGTKPTWQNVSAPTYVLTYSLSGITVKDKDGNAMASGSSVTEGYLKLILTPQSANHVFSSISINGESVASTPVSGSNDGSVYIEIIVNGNITLEAAASSGVSVSLGNNSDGCSMPTDGQLLSENFSRTITAFDHWTVPNGITVKINGTTTLVPNTDYTYTTSSNGKTATLFIDKSKFASATSIEVTCEAVENNYIKYTWADSNIVVTKNGSPVTGTEVKVWSDEVVSADVVLVFAPAVGYKWSSAPTIGSVTVADVYSAVTNIIASGTSISSKSTESVGGGSTITTAKTTYTVTPPSDSNITAALTANGNEVIAIEGVFTVYENDDIVMSLTPETSYSITVGDVTMGEDTLNEDIDYTVSTNGDMKSIAIDGIDGDVAVAATAATVNIPYKGVGTVEYAPYLYLFESTASALSPLVEIPQGTTSITFGWGSVNRDRFLILYDANGYRAATLMNNSQSRTYNTFDSNTYRYARIMFAISEAANTYIKVTGGEEDLWRGNANAVYGDYKDFIRNYIPDIICVDGYRQTTSQGYGTFRTKADKPSDEQYTEACSIMFSLPGAGAARDMKFYLGPSGGTFYNYGTTNDSWAATSDAELTKTIKAGCTKGFLKCNGGENDLAVAYVKYQNKYVWWGHSVQVADEDKYVEQ